MKTLYAIALSCVWLLAGPALAAGDAAAGQEKSAPCAACHGPEGNSSNPEWPTLAGQGAAYVMKQLQDFKAGGRDNPLMSPQAGLLGDQDMEDIGAYFAAQKTKLGKADEASIALGETIYRGGDAERNIPACTGCHAPNGAGNPAARFPKLAGQHSTYIANQLRAFAAGERSNDPNNMMRDIASRLSNDEIESLAQYVSGLH